MSQVLRSKLWILLLAVAVANSVLWWKVTSPYYFFPADDITLVGSQYNPHIPAFNLSMDAVHLVWRQFSNDNPTALLIQSLACNGLTLCVLGSLIFLLTGNIAAIAAGLLIFMTNSWVAGYYLMASYAPLAGMISILALYLILRGVQSLDQRWFAAAGVTIGFFLTASSAAPLHSLLLAALLLGLISSWSKQQKKWAWLKFLAGTSAVLIGFYHSIYLMAVHLEENANTYHYRDASTRLGYAPKPPWVSFFRVSLVSSPVLTLCLAGALVFAAVFAYRNRGHLKQIDQMWLGLGAIIVAHTVIMDLLPFTKLGRAHFPMFVVGIAFVVTAAHRLYGWFVNVMARRFVLAGFGVMMLAIFVFQNLMNKDMLYVRFSAISFFLSQPADTEVFALADDLQSKIIPDIFGVPTTGFDDVSTLPPKPEGHGRLLILGPHGPRSGRTVLRHSVLMDQILDPAKIYKPTGATEYKFPFYGYFPIFLMEEEISQALYFEGGAADYTNPDLYITFWKL